jgi:hypothetical protein
MAQSATPKERELAAFFTLILEHQKAQEYLKL